MKAWVLSLALIAGLPSVALACSPISYGNSGSPQPVERNLAAALVRQAATVDLVVAESVTPVTLSPELEALLRAGWPADAPPPRVGVTFRVLERLKGQSADTFHLNALSSEHPQSVDVRRQWARERGAFGRPADYWNYGYSELSVEALDNSCHTLPVARLGAQYLVFRDAYGGLLHDAVGFRWRHSGQRFSIQGPVFEEVFPDDPWLVSVRRQAARASS